MAPNHPHKEPSDHSSPEQGKINPDLPDWCLVGRWISNKPICFHATRYRLAHLWMPDHQMDALLTEKNVSSFSSMIRAKWNEIYKQDLGTLINTLAY